MQKIVALLLLVTLSTFGAQAQGIRKVRFESRLEQKEDKKALVVITARIDQGWHLYSFNPGGDGSLISPEIVIVEDGNVKPTGKAKEEGKLITEDIDGVGTVHYFKEKVDYTQAITYSDKKPFKVAFSYQVCDDQSCLPPQTDTLDVGFDQTTAQTTSSDTSSNQASADVSSNNTYGDFGTPIGDCGKGQKEELSIMTALLYGILGGFAALFFPCTLPMIPMTISFFLKGSGDKKKGVQRGILYGFFIFLVYFLLSLPFLFLGWGGNVLNSFSTNVWVNLVFFIIFIFFAFSLFGYYDISLPSSLASKIDSRSSISSAGGIFFMALTLAIVSFSCTGPILGLVLGNISNAKLITPAMAGFGIGLGVPFALFAMFPNLLKALPKSGGWLNVLKVVFGFIELAFALKFLSNADLVKQWGLLKRELFIGLWIVVCILMALYLLGYFRFKKDPTFKSTAAMKVLAVLSVIFAGYLSLDFFGKDINLVSGFPPPKFYSWMHKEEKLAAGSKSRTHELKGLKVYLYLEDAIEEAKRQNKPVMIDFTGWACVNCRKMEENVWTLPSVNNLLSNDYIIASLYVDEQIELPEEEKFETPYLDKKRAITVGDKWFDLSLRHFKSATQPFYALIDPYQKRILNTPVGYTPNESEYKAFLQCGLENFNVSRKQL